MAEANTIEVHFLAGFIPVFLPANHPCTSPRIAEAAHRILVLGQTYPARRTPDDAASVARGVF